jgi:HEAT repeat protein
LAQAAARANDPSVRAAICGRLWGNVATVDICLSLVQNSALRDEVLATAGDLSQPMLDALLTRLNAEDPNVRLAAALVLGRADGPIVTEALIGLVSENPACHAETWIALMARRGPQTEQFLAFATGQPRLLGSLNRARVYWARITN